jgi:hypothetical protein
MNSRCCSLILALIAPLAFAQETEFAWKGPDRPVYVVTENHYAEGFTPAGNTSRFGDLIAIEIFNRNERPAGEDATFKIGERVALFVGGRKAGYITIKKAMPLQCDSSAAVVSAGPSVRLAKDAMALATNAEAIRPHVANPRQARSQECAEAKQLAMSEFSKHGVPVDLVNAIKIDQLVATRIDGSDNHFLIGSLFLEQKGVRHEIFLIAKIADSKSTIELARYHQTTDIEDGTDSEDVRFVDQLDFDSDGTDEIVIEVTGYESEEFDIYRRQDSLWRQVHVGGQGGC